MIAVPVNLTLRGQAAEHCTTWGHHGGRPWANRLEVHQGAPSQMSPVGRTAGASGVLDSACLPVHPCPSCNLCYLPWSWAWMTRRPARVPQPCVGTDSSEAPRGRPATPVDPSRDASRMDDRPLPEPPTTWRLCKTAYRYVRVRACVVRLHVKAPILYVWIYSFGPLPGPSPVPLGRQS